jgi:single-strand DNA-binding protein
MEVAMQGIEAALQGTLSRDPELKTSAAGKPWCRVSIAVLIDGATTWVSVAAFGEEAQRLCASAKKGMTLYAEGSLKPSSWEGRDGVKRSGLELAAWRIRVIGVSALGENKPKRPKAPRRDEQPAANGQTTSAQRDWQRPPAGDEQIPF